MMLDGEHDPNLHQAKQEPSFNQIAAVQKIEPEMEVPASLDKNLDLASNRHLPGI